MSLCPSSAERDAMLRKCWKDARFSQPTAPEGQSQHYNIQVLGVVDDPTMRLRGDDKPFVDVVSYWPALNKWTITHCSRADSEADDYPIRVTYYQDMIPLPW